MGIGKLLWKPNKLRGNDLQWTSIPSRGSRNTPSHFMLQKPGISSSSYDLVGSKASFLFILKRVYYMQARGAPQCHHRVLIVSIEAIPGCYQHM